MTTPAPINYNRPWMYAKQRDAIFCDERYGIIEASTKTGKTVGCMVWLAEQAMQGKAGRNYWWVAPIYPTAKIAYRRLKRSLPKGIYTSNETELTLTMANEAVVWFKGADKPDSLYGEDVYAAVIDEATRCKEDAWHAVRSTLTATRGPVRIIGNVKGRKNWAYQLARRAESGAPNMHYAKLTAWDAVEGGVLARSEVEDARSTLPESVFKELYLAEPSDDEGNPFGIAAIQAVATLRALEGAPRWWGWDLAKSVDYTVGIAIDERGHVCRLERWQKLPWEDTVKRIRSLTGSAPALVDSTGVGDPIVERLQEHAGSRYEGLKFTSVSKQQLMEGLAAAIQTREVWLPNKDSGVPHAAALINELESFEYEYSRTGVKYSAPEGMHDDTVMALGLAVRCRGNAPPPPAAEAVSPEPGWSDRRRSFGLRR